MEAHERVTPVEGTVTLPHGFRAGGVHCGIKSRRPDLALVLSEGPASAAGMFTQIATRAAAVEINERKLEAGRAQAVLVNSGNANACTGERGVADAHTMSAAAARALGIDEPLVLATSTGVIGRPLPVDRITAGLPRLLAALDGNGMGAAKAIMTTDKFPKAAAARVDLGDGEIRIGAIAKGAGMVHPDMATMIAIITTDAALEAPVLRRALRAAVDTTFNCISVDGDTSTSDSVFVLANGASGLPPVKARGPRYEALAAGLRTVCEQLARLIVRDGEGSEHEIEVSVRRARSDAEARLVGRTVMTSVLVKTAFNGAQLNWGRIAAAVGRSGAEVDPGRLTLLIGDIVVASGNEAAPGIERAEPLLDRPEVQLTIDLGLGDGTFTGWMSDLGVKYVRFNAGALT